MYAIKKFKVIPPKETLIVLLEAEEANRLKAAASSDRVVSELRHYKRLTALLSLLMVVGSVSLLSAYC